MNGVEATTTIQDVEIFNNMRIGFPKNQSPHAKHTWMRGNP